MHSDLADLLRRRVAIIADHAWRDRDPDAHLQALKDISLEITAWSDSRKAGLDPRLRHYLANASYHKALAHLEQS